MTTTERTNLKMFWFARWLAMCYAGVEPFNEAKGKWYTEQLGHFNRVIYKKWLKQAKKTGDLRATLDLIKKG